MLFPDTWKSDGTQSSMSMNKFCWNPAIPIPFCIVSGCFCWVVATEAMWPPNVKSFLHGPLQKELADSWRRTSIVLLSNSVTLFPANIHLGSGGFWGSYHAFNLKTGPDSNSSCSQCLHRIGWDHMWSFRGSGPTVSPPYGEQVALLLPPQTVSLGKCQGRSNSVHSLSSLLCWLHKRWLQSIARETENELSDYHRMCKILSRTEAVQGDEGLSAGTPGRNGYAEGLKG